MPVATYTKPKSKKRDKVLERRITVEEIKAKYPGLDNYKRPKSVYADKIVAMDDKALESEIVSMIHMSARCNNKPRADWHWMVDACWDECMHRHGNTDLYSTAYDICVKTYAG